MREEILKGGTHKTVVYLGMFGNAWVTAKTQYLKIATRVEEV